MCLVLLESFMRKCKQPATICSAIFFFKLILNICDCPLSGLRNLICMFKDVRPYLYGSFLYMTRKEHHIRNSNKNLLHGPGYCLVNAVELSLQLGRINYST